MFQLLQTLNANSFLWNQVPLLFATMASFYREIPGAISKLDSWKWYCINGKKKFKQCTVLLLLLNTLLNCMLLKEFQHDTLLLLMAPYVQTNTVMWTSYPVSGWWLSLCFYCSAIGFVHRWCSGYLHVVYLYPFSQAIFPSPAVPESKLRSGFAHTCGLCIACL